MTTKLEIRDGLAYNIPLNKKERIEVWLGVAVSDENKRIRGNLWTVRDIMISKYVLTMGDQGEFEQGKIDDYIKSPQFLAQYLTARYPRIRKYKYANFKYPTQYLIDDSYEPKLLIGIDPNKEPGWKEKYLEKKIKKEQ